MSVTKYTPCATNDECASTPDVKADTIPTMKNLWLITLLFLICMPLSAQTKDFPENSGNAFLRLCSVVDKDVAQLTADQAINLTSCLSYVRGFSDGEIMEWTYVQNVTKRDAPQPFCVPVDAENSQLIRIVLKYIRDNPEEAHNITVVSILGAFVKAFPCPTK